MSMWDWDEQGESYPPEDRQQYRDLYASHSGSSDYHGAHQSYRDHSHHHHGHTGHNHDQHHHQHDDAHSYHGQQSAGTSPSHHSYGMRHELNGDPGAHQNYGGHESEGGEDRDHQNYGWHDSNDNQGHDHNSYRSPTHASNMIHAQARQSTHYHNNEGYNSSEGYEIWQAHHSPPPPPPPPSRHGHEASDQTNLNDNDSVVNLTLDEIDALARTHRSCAWLVVLYAPWCRFCQAMEPNFERVAQHLENSNVYVGRFRADGNYKEYAKRYLQLEHFPTVLFFPKDSSNIVKYHSENREVDALLGFVQAFE